jgi:hypothetical protein
MRKGVEGCTLHQTSEPVSRRTFIGNTQFADQQAPLSSPRHLCRLFCLFQTYLPHVLGAS